MNKQLIQIIYNLDNKKLNNDIRHFLNNEVSTSRWDYIIDYNERNRYVRVFLNDNEISKLIDASKKWRCNNLEYSIEAITLLN